MTYYAVVKNGIVIRIIQPTDEALEKLKLRKDCTYIEIKEDSVLLGAAFDGKNFINPNNEEPDEVKEKTLEEKIEKIIVEKLNNELSKNISLGPK